MKTYLDSSVLIHAWKKQGLSAVALTILSDDARQFYSSQFARLEVLPKARFHGNELELEFYAAHFEEVVESEPLSEALGNEAQDLANRYGMAGPDALQIAAALRHGVQEFYTSEKPGKPMFRVKELKVISLHDLRN